MGAHALGAVAYAAKAVSLAMADREAARRDQVRWQIDRMTPDVRAALARLPVPGENSSGPLGTGPLASMSRTKSGRLKLKLDTTWRR